MGPKEWSAWIVAVQSALIGYLATGAKPSNAWRELTVNLSLGSFAVSILAAAWVLSALPYVLIRLREEKDPNIYFMNLSSAPVLNLIPLWLMGAVQHWAFAVGLLIFITGRVLND